MQMYVDIMSTLASSELEGDGVRPIEAEGLRLHLSDTNASGYKGVDKKESGRFHAQLSRDGKQEQLGTFDTAVEAAVA